MIGWFESLGIGTPALRWYVWYAVGLLALWLLRKALRPRAPSVSTVIAMVMAMAVIRLVAFDNPIALRVYRSLVTPESIGARQWDTLDQDIAAYARPLHPPPLPNLAVGSSQVGAIFSHWTGDEPLGMFSLAGMKTPDYVLHQEEIAAANPARVVLYLSAFDLTAGPEATSWSLAPSHPLGMMDFISRVRHSGAPSSVVDGGLREYVAGQLLPEYRYRYVYKGLLTQWLTRVTDTTALASWIPTLHAAEPMAAPASGGDPTLDERARVFRSYYALEWLDYNVGFLRDFLEFCRERGIDVTIVEGQVSPLVASPQLDLLERLVRARFEELALLFANVRIVTLDEQPKFEARDYRDFTHVHPEAARRYTGELARVLGRAIVPMTGACDVTLSQGWHPTEGPPDDRLTWSRGNGQLRIRSRVPGTHVLSAEVLSFARPNRVGVMVDGALATQWAINDTAWAFHPTPPLEVDVDAGQTVALQLVSESAPVSQPNDPRPLTIAVRNVRLTAPGGTVCAVNVP